MTDLGELHHFLGLAVRRDSSGMFLSQTQYALEILERAGMSSCHPASTPVDTSPKLAAAAGLPVADPSEYRSLAGALQYLTFTRPDIAYTVQHICLHMHDPRDQHLPWSSGFSATSRVPCTTAFSSHPHPRIAGYPAPRPLAHTLIHGSPCCLH